MDSTTGTLYKNTLMNVAHRTPCSENKDGKKCQTAVSTGELNFSVTKRHQTSLLRTFL